MSPSGRLTSLIDASRESPPERPRRSPGAWLKGALVDNLPLKLLSMILAVTVYLLINTDEHREINARVRVAYILPPGKALVSERVDEVRVTIRGPWRRIKRFDEREIDRIDLDVSGYATGGEVTIDPSRIALPRGLTITSIQPKVVRVAFEELVDKTVPVVPTLAGRPLVGYQAVPSRTTAEPTMVTVRGAAGTVAALEQVRTREIRVDGRSDRFVASVPLVPPDGVELIGADSAEVSVAIEEELVTRRIAKVAVTVLAPPPQPGTPAADPAGWRVEPHAVDIVLTGGVVAVERWMEEGVVATVTLPPDAGAAKGPVTLQVDVGGGARAGVGVTITPEKVVARPRR